MQNQIVIQIILIAVFAIFAIILVIPGRGARGLAVRRLTLLAAFVAAIIAVVFPGVINGLANLLGVGRGTDLVLYALVVVFIGNSIASAAQNRQLHREITALARSVALRDAQAPDPE
jgi:small membrane protein